MLTRTNNVDGCRQASLFRYGPANHEAKHQGAFAVRSEHHLTFGAQSATSPGPTAPESSDLGSAGAIALVAIALTLAVTAWALLAWGWRRSS